VKVDLWSNDRVVVVCEKSRCFNRFFQTSFGASNPVIIAPSNGFSDTPGHPKRVRKPLFFVRREKKRGTFLAMGSKP